MGRLLSFAFAFLLSAKSFGMVVSITLAWNQSLSSYNLQEGSIVQVIGYTRPISSPPNQGNSFSEIELGTYDPYSTPNGHEILYQTAVGEDQNPGKKYEYFFFFTTDESFNRIYIRIFQSDGFSDEVELSYWGLSNSGVVPGGTVYANTWNNLSANNQSAFRAPYFEVIPEPPPIRLVLMGLAAIYLFGAIARRKTLFCTR